MCDDVRSRQLQRLIWQAFIFELETVGSYIMYRDLGGASLLIGHGRPLLVCTRLGFQWCPVRCPGVTIAVRSATYQTQQSVFL